MYNAPPPEANPAFEALLNYLRRSHSFDFTGYKRSSLMRRVDHRMRMIAIESYSDYVAYLEGHLEELIHLFNTILINVTGFFRDASAREYVAKSIVPWITARKSSDEPIRVWSAGCASGEETYTLAMVLAEALGMEQYGARVRIYSTDLDEEALNQARQGSYLSTEVAGIPPALLNQYFEQADDRYVICKDLRRAIIFCRHNLIHNAPMSNIDLLVCRNVLIYFNIETQTRVLVRFHFGLKDSGFLFLGSTEIVPTEMGDLFTRVDLRHHIFTKSPRVKLSTRLLIKALKKPQQRSG